MRISIRDDIHKITAHMDSLQRKQIPFATSRALNDTAFLTARKNLPRAAKKQLDRPTPFTLRGFKYKRSNKRNLTAEVSIAPIQWSYLKRQITGGTRHPARKFIPVPFEANIKLNKYGNISYKRQGIWAIRNKRQFIATIKGITGVWERTKKKGGRVRLIIAMEKQVTHTKNFDYYGVISTSVKKHFNREFIKHLNKALLTAR